MVQESSNCDFISINKLMLGFMKHILNHRLVGNHAISVNFRQLEG